MPTLNRRHFLTTAAGTCAALSLAHHPADAAEVSFQGRIRKAVKFHMVTDDNLSLHEKFQLLKDLGYDGTEIHTKLVLDKHEVKAASEAAGLPIHGVINSNSADISGAVDLSKFYGGTSVLVVAGRVNEDMPYDVNWKKWLGRLQEAAPYAQQQGIRLLVENVWNNFLLSPLEMARFIDEIDNEAVGVYFDVGNVVRFGWPEQWIRILGSRIGKLDIKEYSRKLQQDAGLWKGFNVEIGEGSCGWPAVREALDEIGFEGWATAEVRGEGPRPPRRHRPTHGRSAGARARLATHFKCVAKRVKLNVHRNGRPLLVGVGPFERREFELFDLRQARADDRAEVAVQAGGAEDGPFELFLAFGPHALHRPFFFLQILAQCDEGFDDAFHAVPEFRAGQIAVHDGHFILTSVERPFGGSDLDQSVPQRGGQSGDATAIGHPHAFDTVERRQPIRQFRGRDDGELRLGRALVVAKFGEPAIVPVLGSLGFPEDRAAGSAVGIADMLGDVPPVNAFGDRDDLVEGKLAAEQFFQAEFHHLALQLLRLLLGLAIEFGNLFLEVTDHLLALGEVEFGLFRSLAFGIVANLLPLLVQFAGDGQFELLLLLFEFTGLFAELEFGLLGFLEPLFEFADPRLRILEFSADGLPRFHERVCGDLFTLFRQTDRHLLVDGLFRFFQLPLRISQLAGDGQFELLFLLFKFASLFAMFEFGLLRLFELGLHFVELQLRILHLGVDRFACLGQSVCGDLFAFFVQTGRHLLVDTRFRLFEFPQRIGQFGFALGEHFLAAACLGVELLLILRPKLRRDCLGHLDVGPAVGTNDLIGHQPTLTERRYSLVHERTGVVSQTPAFREHFLRANAFFAIGGGPAFRGRRCLPANRCHGLELARSQRRRSASVKHPNFNKTFALPVLKHSVPLAGRLA